MIAVLILAAGGSTRLGRPKQLEPWGRTNLLGQVVAEAKQFDGVQEVWVVLGAELDTVLEQVDLSDCGVVENPEWEDGIASSLRAGLDAINRLSKADSVLVMLGDQPGVSSEVVAELLAKGRRSKAMAIVPKYRYAAGNPVLLDRVIWPRLMSLAGDVGASEILRAHPEWVEEVWFDSLPPRDVDSALDVQELRPRN